ncbi:hypothetical protein Ahia01_000414400 [Argonauta hians]
MAALNVSNEMDDAELLQQMAALYWLYQEDSSLYKAVTLGRVAHQVWKRVSDESKIEALRTQTIMSIAAYVKEHPRASEKELIKEVQKRIEEFKTTIENM